MNIGFIGTGVMGSSMAGHLLKAGHQLCVHNRSKHKAEQLLKSGALWADSIQKLCEQSDIIITILGYPKDVEAVYCGPGGLAQYSKAGDLWIDMTTSDPSLAKTIHDKAQSLGIGSLDAPVSGGDIGAREARLSIMVGGSEEDFQRAKPLFEIMGQNIVYQGEAGSGQHTKMSNQIAIASGMLGVCEAIAYAQNHNLDPQKVLQSIESGAAGSWSLSNLAPRMLKGDFEPGFFLKHFIKDMEIALNAAKSKSLATPGLEAALKIYKDLNQRGMGDKGTQALYQHYQ